MGPGMGPRDAGRDDPFPHSSDDRGGDFGLSETIKGDTAGLSVYSEDRFYLIFHPRSNAFVPDLLPVSRETFGLLRPGGSLLAVFTKPITYLFDEFALGRGG